ncbi:hypothetical protein N7454_005405 [Penicillium verhagenii]|nr:hypothetical protein N7454_005405 [Penicillium verhagenii]
MDREATMEDINETMASYQADVKSLSNMIQRQEMKDVVAAMPIVIGKVLVTSGASILRKSLIDWAFVEVFHDADAPCRPNEMFEIPPSKQPVDYIDIEEIGAAAISAGSTINHFDTLEKGKYCTKIGWASEVTAGLPATGETDRRFTHDRKEVSMLNSPSREYVILNKKKNAADSDESGFTMDGYSGSFVLNRFGGVMGILFGGIKSQFGDGVISVSMDDLALARWLICYY